MNMDGRYCPVCGGPMACSIDRIEGTVCENDETCSKSCWEYHFAYGFTRVWVGVRWFNWSYTEEDPHEEIRQAVLQAMEERK